MSWTSWIVLVQLALLPVGCGGSKEASAPRREVALSLGDCAFPESSWISGPQPRAFTVDQARVTASRTFAAHATVGDLSMAIEGRMPVDLGGIGDDPGVMSGGFGFAGVGNGRYGTIGAGPIGGGRRYGIPSGGSRPPVPPIMRLGTAVVQGELDKAIIRRYVKRSAAKLSYCFEREQVVDPKLPAGTVTANFVIGVKGAVLKSDASGVSPIVATCVAGVVKEIEFPKPKGGAPVLVQYPLEFRRRVTAEPAKPDAPAAPAVPDEPGYLPGATTPLRAVERELTACLRAVPAPYGVGVIELGKGAPVAHGIDDPTLATCIGELGPSLASATAQRCAFAWGTMPIADAPGLDVRADQLSFRGTAITEPNADELSDVPPTISLVMSRAAAHTQEALARREVLVKHGPLVVRADASAPMETINRVVRSLISSGEHPVLAIAEGDGWRALRPISLPVLPVPLGTGRAWTVDHRAHTPEPRLSILLTADRTWLVVSGTQEVVEVEAGDTAGFEAEVSRLKGAHLGQRTDVELAAEGPVTYGQLTEAIARVTKLGLTGWTVTTPETLTSNPTI